jgi:hypothetical protein
MVIPPIRINDLYGHDFRRVVLPFCQLRFLKGGCFDVFVIGIIVDLDLERGAACDFNLNTEAFHRLLLLPRSARLGRPNKKGVDLHYRTRRRRVR